MSKITIREVDETTVGGVVINSTDIVYIPGFSVLDQVDDAEIGLPHVPVLCRTIAEFEKYFGVLTPTFNADQPYPTEFDNIAIPTDIHGSPKVMFHKDEPDPSYIEAKELIASGLQVLYERVNEIGELPSVSKMYTTLSSVFDKSYSGMLTTLISYAPPYDSTSAYTAGTSFCSYEGQNYRCTTTIDAGGEAWNPEHWTLVNDYTSYSIAVTSPYTLYETFYNSGTYKFEYSKYSRRSIDFTAASSATKVAMVYDASKIYTAGDHCTYANNVFACLKTTTGDFDSSCWTLANDWGPNAFVTFYESTWDSFHPLDGETYVFTYDSSTNKWLDSSEAAVDLLVYGIKATGTFANGDEITVVNAFESGWVYKNELYDLSSCGLTISMEQGRTLQYGDNFSVYLDTSDPLLLDRGLYSFKYLTSGGYPIFEYANNSIEKQMVNLCYTRGDAVALIDHTDNPNRSLTGLSSVDYAVKSTINILPSAVQSFAAMFTPSVEMTLINSYIGESFTDSTNVRLKSTAVLPASFAYLSCLSNSLKIAPSWNAVAGATRGKVYGLVAPRTTKALTNAIADSFTPDNEVAINPITNIRPYGQCIWGNRTLVDNSIKQGTTAVSFLNIRNLVSDVKKQLFVACQSLLFEQNTDVLWVNFLSLVTPVLDKMVSGFGIHNYKIIKLPDSDKTQINVRIRLYPVYAVESFDITIYLNDQGVYLDGEV